MENCTTCSGAGTCSGGCVACNGVGGCGSNCTGGAYASRPANFAGFVGVAQGADCTALTAVDWNAFIERLVAFALYKNKGTEVGTFITVGTGNFIYADLAFNRAVQALNVLSAYISQPIPTQRVKWDDLYASYFQALKNALNSIT